jgi:HEAT repeat protein
MTRVYVSSTFVDLQPFRESVRALIQTMGLIDVSMETYVAEDQRPLDKCLNDVRTCDLYLGIVAWRYGYIPTGEHCSITELECRAAGAVRIERLIFMLDAATSWPPGYMDSHSGDGESGNRIRAFRCELENACLVSYFSTPENLATRVASAIHAWQERSRHATDQRSFILDASTRNYLSSIIEEGGKIQPYYVQLSGSSKQVLATPPTEWPSEMIPTAFAVVSERYRNTEITDAIEGTMEDVAARISRFVLLGEPGGGKSTSLKALRLAMAGEALKDPSTRIPVLINLAEWPSTVSDLRSLLVYECHAQGIPLPPMNRLLLLFDGLDEMGASGYEEKAAAIDHWLKRNPELPVIFASRERHYREHNALPLATVTIHELDDDRVREFTNKYLGLAEAALLRQEIEESYPNARVFSDFVELARNPFLLSLICFVYTTNGRRLPQNRGQLFRLFVQTLHRREKERGNTRSINCDTLTLCLGRVAFGALQNRAASSMPLDWARKIITLSTDTTALWQLGAQSTLIRLTKGDRFLQFRHKMVQEYFAAEHLCRNLDDVETFFRPPAARPGYHPFEEVFYTLLGLGDAEEILTRVSTVDPALASRGLKSLGDNSSVRERIFGKITSELVNLLQHENADVRTDALVQLSEFGSAVIPTLKATLIGSSVGSVRRQCLAALWAISHPESIEAVVNALHDKQRWIRRDAQKLLSVLDEQKRCVIESLLHTTFKSYSQMEQKSTAMSLLGCLAPSEVILRKTICDLVGYDFGREITDRFTAPDARMVPLDATRTPDATGGDEGPRQLADMIRELGATSTARAGKLIKQIAAIGEEAVLPLIAALDSDNERIRRRAPRVLALLNDLRAVWPLVRLCEDSRPRVRAHAVRALGILQHASALDAAWKLSSDPFSWVRMEAVQVLCTLGDLELDELRETILSDPNSDIRIRGLYSLRNKKSTEAIELLQGFLRDPAPGIRALAAKIWAEWCPDSLSEIEGLIDDPFPHVREVAARVLIERDPALGPRLLRSPHHDVQAVSLSACFRAGILPKDHHTLNLLEPLLADPRAYVRGPALRTLGAVFGDDSLPAVMSYVTDESKDVRWAVIRVLEHSDSPEAIVGLQQLLTLDPLPEIRRAAATALDRFRQSTTTVASDPAG